MTNFAKQYIELLEYDKSLRKDGMYLETHEKEKYREMLRYAIQLSDHVHWQQRNDYLNLMKKFVGFEITGKQFVNQFYKLHRSNEAAVNNLETDLKRLKNFEPNPKSFGFTKWTSEMELGCDEFYPDLPPQKKINFFARDEENFRTFIANILPEIEKYC